MSKNCSFCFTRTFFDKTIKSNIVIIFTRVNNNFCDNIKIGVTDPGLVTGDTITSESFFKFRDLSEINSAELPELTTSTYEFGFFCIF